MSTKRQNQAKETPQSSFTPAPQALLQRQCACGQHADGGECADCRAKREGTLQRAAVTPNIASGVPSVVHDVLSSSGQPLDTQTRSFMEPRFSHDFSQVRVHTDERAAESARSVNALAYTVGQDLVFGQGHYDPRTSEGKQLLAHELTHVVQQNSSIAVEGAVEGSTSPLEREADAAAQAVMSADSITVGRGEVVPSLQRVEGTATHRGRFDAAQEHDAILYTLAQGYDEKSIKLIQEVVGADIDGDYGGGTVESVGQWQSTHGLVVDGKTGPETLWTIITELRNQGRDLDALHLAESVRPTRKFTTDTGADVTSLESGAPPGGAPLTEADADSVLTIFGLLGKVIKLAPPSDRYDCHGFTFLSGAAWIDDDQVDAILSANGYSITATPSVGDIVIYRSGGDVKHSGLITAVSGATVTQIHSKWGRLGLYSHAPDDVPPSYGTWAAFTTARPGGALLNPKP